MPTTLPAGHALEGRADLIILAGENLELAVADSRRRRLGRCAGDCGQRGGRVGVIWQHVTGANLAAVKCPVCAGELRQTTPGFRARFYRLTEAYVRQCVADRRAADNARAAELVAQGSAKRVADLEPGDVIIAAGQPARVVEVLGVGAGRSGHKTRTAVKVARLVRAVQTHQPWATIVVELRNAELVYVHDTAGPWADLEPGVALLHLARAELDRFTRWSQQAARDAETYRGRRTADTALAQARLYAADAYRAALLVHALEAAAELEEVGAR